MTTNAPGPLARVVACVLLGALATPACGGTLAGTTTTTAAETTAPAPAAPRSEQDPELQKEPAPPREAATADPESADHRVGRVAGWVTLAVGIQATLVALVTSGMMLHEDGVRGDECDAQKRCTQAGLDANDNLKQLGVWNAGAWAVGAAGIGVGTVLLLLNPPRDRARPAKHAERSTELVLGGAGAPGLGLRGSF